MTWTIASYAVGVVLLGIYCLLVLPTAGWRRYAAPVALGLLYADLLFCGVQALGRPKPGWFELPGQDEARLVAYSLDEGHAIYLWLQPRESAEPVAYQIPWQEQQASAIYEASRQGKATGQPVIVQGFNSRHPGEFKAYAQPVKPLPLKEGS